MNRAERGVTLNLLGSLGCLGFGVDGMLVGRGGDGVAQSPVWGFIFIGSILLLGLGTYLQLTSVRGARSDFLPFPKPGDLRRRKIRRPTDVS
jgi:TM2 domain-containing membrane protein YozV